MKTFVIGDVHGCIDEFKELVGMANKEDRILQVGDLMDRGPEPAACVQFARERGIECVMGNHEEKHLRWRRHQEKFLAYGKKNPMRPLAPEAQEQNAKLTPADVAWMAGRPFMINLDGWVVVHAGIEPRYDLENQNPDALLRIRYVNSTGAFVSSKDGTLDQPPDTVPWMQLYNDKKSVVYGHAVHGPRPRSDTCHVWGVGSVYCAGIDTGCCFGGGLTALIIDGDRHSFATVPAQKLYYDHNIPPTLLNTPRC